MDASTARIGFIGFGNMAQAMAKGLVEHAGFDGGRITACAAHFDKLEASCKPLGANAVHTPAEVAEASDLVIVAVKPYMVADVLTPAREALAGKAVVSVAAGLLFDFYEDLLGAGSHHLSTIPNTPIAVGCGVIACEQKHSLATDEWETFTGLFGGIALIEPVAGHLLSTASAVAGCGPAFAAVPGVAGRRRREERPAPRHRVSPGGADDGRHRAAASGHRHAPRRHEGRRVQPRRHHHQGRGGA